MLILILPKTPMELKITVSFAQHGTCLGRYLSYSRGLTPLNKPYAAATEVCSMPTSRSFTTRRNPRVQFKNVQQIVGQNNPRTGAPHPKGLKRLYLLWNWPVLCRLVTSWRLLVYPAMMGTLIPW